MQLNIWVTVVLPSDAVLVWFGLVFLLVVWFGLVLRIGDPCTSLARITTHPRRMSTDNPLVSGARCGLSGFSNRVRTKLPIHS